MTLRERERERERERDREMPRDRDTGRQTEEERDENVAHSRTNQTTAYTAELHSWVRWSPPPYASRAHSLTHTHIRLYKQTWSFPWPVELMYHNVVRHFNASPISLSK